MITREYLEARIAEFTVARDKCQADVAANNGAIQLCQHLLANLAAESDAAQKAIDKAVEQGEQPPKGNGGAPAP